MNKENHFEWKETSNKTNSSTSLRCIDGARCDFIHHLCVCVCKLPFILTGKVIRSSHAEKEREMDLPIISMFVSSFCWFVFFNCNKCIDKQLNWKRTTQFDIVDICYVTLSILHTSTQAHALMHTHTHTFMDVDHRTSSMHGTFFLSHLVLSSVCDASLNSCG